MAKKKAAKASSTEPVVPTSPPEQAPLPGQLQTYVPVPNEALAQHMKTVSLDQVRIYLKKKVELLQAYHQDCPGALFSDVENVIVHLQVAQIGEVVRRYIPLMETLKFWRTFCGEKEREVESTRKLYQRTLKQTVRSTWDTSTQGKITNDAVDDKVRTDKDHQSWLIIQEHWEYLGYQLQQIIDSMQTEILVQASMWERAQDLPQANIPPGAVSGQASV